MDLNERSGFQLKYQSRVDELVDSQPEVWDGTVEVVNANDRTYVLVGVTHWHPVAIERVGTMISELQPSTIGLEIPQELIDPYVDLVESDKVECEMTAAIDAADNDTALVGMDAPSPDFDKALDNVHDDLTKKQLGRVEAEMARIKTDVEEFCDGGAGREVPEYAAQAKGKPIEVQVADEKISVRKAEVAIASLKHGRETFDKLREASWVKRIRKSQKDGMTMVVCGMKHMESLAKQLK